MNLDQLNDTFAAHESLAPDAGEVLTRSHEIARSLKRRQWVVRSTSGVALGAAVVVGGVVVPHALHHGAGNNAVIKEASGGGPPASAATPYTTDQEWSAYFDAGYTYDDAVHLARIWNESTAGDGVGNVKAEAGGKLLAGDTLPIPPSGTPATPQEKALEAFWDAGYTYDDAVQLGQAWHETDINQVKVEAGQKLEDGESLPVQPSGTKSVTPVADKQDTAVQVFFNAGYTYDDAVQLSKTWHTSTPYQAKVEGGLKLEKGETLPIAP